MAAGGLALCTMNAVMRLMTLELNPMVAFFLRYVMGLVVMLPMLMRDGLAAYRPNNPSCRTFHWPTSRRSASPPPSSCSSAQPCCCEKKCRGRAGWPR